MSVKYVLDPLLEPLSQAFYILINKYYAAKLLILCFDSEYCARCVSIELHDIEVLCIRELFWWRYSIVIPYPA